MSYPLINRCVANDFAFYLPWAEAHTVIHILALAQEAPKGRRRVAPGVSPGLGAHKQPPSPEGAAAWARGASPVAGWGAPGLAPGASAVVPTGLGLFWI